MFGVVPRTLWERHHTPDDQNRIEMTLNSLLIRDGSRVILVDTGVGYKWSEKLAKIYKIDHSEHNLEKSLTEKGLKTTDVTDVILTHLHFDHVGGATYYSGGEAVPTFPNATYHIQKKQWEWAYNPSLKDRASYFSENYDALATNGRLNTIDGSGELYPGITLVEVNGHTESQQLVKISDGKRTLFHCGDLIPLHSQVAVPWVMAYDLRPLTTIREKQAYLTQAVVDNWLLFFTHDPRVLLARVEEGKKGFQICDQFESFENLN